MNNTTLSYGGRDPNVVVIDGRGNVFRYVPEVSDERWSGLRGFIESETFRDLMDAKLVVRHSQIPIIKCYFEAERIVHFSNYKFWTWRQRISAISQICRLNRALESTNWRAYDCHIENITFRFSDPVYVDVGSFSQYDRESVVGFFKDYTKEKIGVSLISDTWDGLLAELSVLAVPQYQKTEWTEYHQGEPSREHELVIGWAQKHGAGTISDVGCNRGKWSKMFAERCKVPVLALDCDEQCVDYCWGMAKETGLPITSLWADLSKNPLGLPNSEMAVFSSLLHHWYRAVPSWSSITEMMDRLATRLMAVEWISGDDPDVATWTNLERKEYDLEHLLAHFQKWELVESANPEAKYRTWLLLQRKPEIRT